MESATFKLYGLGALLAMLVLFSVLGYMAMRPGATQKNIDAFWVTIILFLIFLAFYIFVCFSRLLAVAPLIPAFIFGRLFFQTRLMAKKNVEDE